MSPVEVEACKKALDTIKGREEELLVNAINVTEEKIKEDRRQEMKEKMIKAKYLAAKIPLLNRDLAKILKELDEDRITLK